MSENLRTYTDAAGGGFDHRPNALTELYSPRVIDIDLGPHEVVCEECHLTFHAPLGDCPSCVA